MSRWIEPEPLVLAEDFATAVGRHPIVAQLLTRRGYSSLETAQSFLDPNHYSSAPAETMPGIREAVPLLARAIHNQEPILVWGDFDVDGQTATTLLVTAIQQLGGRVHHYIPVRSVETHGVHPERLLSLIKKDQIQLLLTCDTGISAHQGIAAAKRAGLEVILTDHHELPDQLPPADVVVTPRLLPNLHPMAGLPGVGVAYKLAEALFEAIGVTDQCETFLDLVALGIVADVAWLTGDTRYLLQKGLKILQNTSRLGLQALVEQAELKLDGLTSEHIAFNLAPRLNALGRLGDANSIVEFFSTTDRTRARNMAIELEALNARRKLLTDQVFSGALAQVEFEPKLADFAAIVIAHPSWPGGVIGIVASRLVEYFHKPVVLIASPPGETARGSARSIPGVNITEAIATQSKILTGYGGHPMAAGLGILPEDIGAFRERLSKAVAKQISTISKESELQIDSWVNFSDLSLELVAELYHLAPFGPGNPAPILAARSQRIKSQRQIGRYQEHLLLKLEDENQFIQEVIWWQFSGLPIPEGKFDLAYTVQPSTYQGQPGVQVAWMEARLLPEEQPIQVKTIPVQFMDLRKVTDLAVIFTEISKQKDFVIWCEGLDCIVPNSVDRRRIKPAATLVIWTIPPGRTELHTVMNIVRPGTILVCAFDPGTDDPKNFLERLAGMAKYAVTHKGGKSSLSQFAAATGHSVATIQAGLEWLLSHGDIAITDRNQDEWVIQFGDHQPTPDLKEREAQLRHFLVETASFRKYFGGVEMNVLAELFD